MSEAISWSLSSGSSRTAIALRDGGRSGRRSQVSVSPFRATKVAGLVTEMSEVRADLREALAQLAMVNAELMTANAQLGTVNTELMTANAQHSTVNAELASANAELASANAEMARRRSFVDALLETIEVGIVSCDADGANLVRNRAERAHVGLDSDSQGLQHELAAVLIDVLDPDGHRVPVQSYPLLRALRGGAVGAVELLLGPAGGPHREVLTHSAQIVDPDGAVLGAVSALTDISAERTATRALAEERRKLVEAQRIGQLGSFDYDFVTETWTCSDQLCLLWGGDFGGSIPETAKARIVEEDRQRAWESWLTACRVGGRHSYEFRIRRANDGAERVIRSAVEVELGPDGQPLHGRGTHLDITDLNQAETAAQKATAFFAAVLTATPDYTFVIDLATGAVIYRSRDVDPLGMTTEQIEALDVEERAALVHPDDQSRLRSAKTAAADLEDGHVLQLRYRGRHVDGQWRWLNRRVTPFRRDDAGTVVEVIAVMRDITDVVEAEDRLAHGALHDVLTGLPNRTLLVDRLDAALARSGRDGREVAVLFCDLDGFKRVNDTAGHAAGDAVLLEIAQRLKSAVRDGDTVARVGGDEFVIVVEPWNRAGRGEKARADGLGDLPDRFLAVRVAERVVEAVRQPISVNGVSHVVTASIGITYARIAPDEHADRTTADQVLQDADAAMYRAKGRGKDRYALFEHGLRTDLAERGRVERVLRRALHRPTGPSRAVLSPRPGDPSLTAAYQPIFDSGTGALVGFEALARLTDAEDLNIPPDVFIAIAEETGTIHPLGAVMLELACRQLPAWREEISGLEHVFMSVNVSALQAQNASLGDDVRRVLKAHGLAPADLVLELTETALLQAAHSTITTLRALHTDGVGIAIDDFGTGYASLRYLATMPVTAIKIDKTFTAGLPHDETSRKIVKAVAGLAADLDLACVVEGVETAEQRAALPDAVQLQGWLTGRPAPAHELDLASLVTNGAPAPPAPPPPPAK